MTHNERNDTDNDPGHGGNAVPLCFLATWSHEIDFRIFHMPCAHSVGVFPTHTQAYLKGGAAALRGAG